MGVRKEDGIVPMEERLVATDISRYKLVRSNWFAYNRDASKHWFYRAMAGRQHCSR